MAIELLRSFLQQATASGAKSTVLTELRWLVGILLSALLIGFYVKAPDWFLILIAVVLSINMLVYFTAYIFFGIRNPDALRSEKFTLSKMAIERSIVGDNISGFIDPEKEPKALISESVTPTIEGHE